MNSQNQQIQTGHKNPKVTIAEARFNLIYPMVEDKENTELIYDAFKDNSRWKFNFTDQEKLNYFNHQKKIIVWACIFQTDKDYTQFDDFLMAFYTWLEEKAEFPLEEKKKDEKGSAKKHVQKQAAGNEIENREHFEREKEREREREREIEREKLREEEEKQRERERERERYEREQKEQRERKERAERERQERQEREFERERQRIQEEQRKMEQQQMQREYKQNQINRNTVPNHPTRSNPQYQQMKQSMPESRQVTHKFDYINKDDFVKKILTKIADIIDLPERKCKSKVEIFASIEELRRLEGQKK